MSTEFRFAYNPPPIRFGPGSVTHLDSELAGLGCERALVVCGQTVGDTAAVLDPVREGLGGCCASVFAQTTPAKRLATAVDCADRLDERDADALVALGSGSGIDVARVAAVAAASEHSPAALGDQLAATGTLSVPDETVPVLTVPTTLAGASLSALAGVSASPDSGLVDAPAAGGVGSDQLMPAVAVYDPQLVAETPPEVLARSAMNGLDKGIETLYASTRTPVTDATASRGLELLARGLPALGLDQTTDRGLESGTALQTVIQGLVLAQYGSARPDGTMSSVLHALGHALRVHSRHPETGAGIQLGLAHAAIAPAALSWLFEQVDGRRDLLASALGADTDGSDPATAVVERVRTLRAELGLPDRLRAVTGVDRASLDDVATTAADSFLEANDAPGPAPESSVRATAEAWRGTPHPPPGLDVSASALRGVLDDAW